MPLDLTAAEVQNITWEQLNQRLMAEPSIATGGDKRLKMQMHANGGATISANFNVFSNAAEQQQLTGFVQATIARSMGPQGLGHMAPGAVPANGVLRANNLPGLSQAVENARPQVWGAKMQNNAHVQPVGLTSAGLTPILQPGAGTQIRPAGAGSGGALLALNPAVENSGGMLIKTEPPVVLKGAALVATLGNNLPQGLKDALPFGMVNYDAVDPNDAGRPLVVQALQAQDASLTLQLQDPNLTQDQQDNLQQTQGSVQAAIDGLNRPVGHNRHREVGRMELVPDSVQLNKLPLPDKLALYKTPEFAQKIGQAMAVCPMLGLNDHMGPGFNNNASNFMINPQNGALTAIDYAANFNQVAPGTGPGGGDYNYGRANPAQDLATLAAFAASPPGAAYGAAQIDVAKTLGAITGGTDDSFFNAADMVVFNQTITPQERQDFEDNLKAGINQGLQTIGQHIDQFEQAYQDLAAAENVADQNLRPFVSRAHMQQIANNLGVNLTVAVPAVGVGGPPAVGVGAPPLGGGPPAVGVGAPPLGGGPPAVGVGAPPLGGGPPAVGVGAPPLGGGPPIVAVPPVPPHPGSVGDLSKIPKVKGPRPQPDHHQGMGI